MGLFDDNLEFNSTEKIDARITKRKAKQKMMNINREQNLVDILPEIEIGEQLLLISAENFGSIELLSVLFKRYEPKEMYITTWSINEAFIDLLRSILSTGAYVNFNVDKSLKTRKHHLWAQIANLAYDFKDKLKVKCHDQLHAKVTAISDGNGNYISVEASANYSKNTRIEQFCITNDQERYNFNKEWIQMI